MGRNWKGINRGRNLRASLAPLSKGKVPVNSDGLCAISKGTEDDKEEDKEEDQEEDRRSSTGTLYCI